MILALFGQPGPMELLIILLVILLLFGAKRLPELARSLGKSLSEFKRGKDEGSRNLDSASGTSRQVEEKKPESDEGQKG